MSRALFISDVHVSPLRPDTVEALLALLEAAAGQIGALYLLGDVFDQWLGDDDDTPPFGAVEAGLRKLSGAGAAIYTLHGNHDFLLGSDFAARTGCTLIDDVVAIELGSTRAVVMHGDTLCTDDTEYQAYRDYTRNADNQRWFLGLDFAERSAMADQLRHQSEALRPMRAEDIMDVNEVAVREALRVHEATLLIHGHTHRPTIHRFDLDGQPARRVVLGDWYAAGTVALFEGEDIELLSVADVMGHFANLA